MKKGKLIVLEGADGSGKSTQIELLKAKLIKSKYKTVTLKFPQYNEGATYFVEQYLSGKYGSIEEVGAKKASIFYALDRFLGAEKIKRALEKDHIVLVDRYVGSNMAHQGSKIKARAKRKEYFQWLYNLEFEILEVPKPNLSIILDVPTMTSVQLLNKSGKTKDLHERSPEHLKKTRQVYLEIAKLFPKNFKIVKCMKNGKLMSPKEVSEKLWKKVSKTL